MTEKPDYEIIKTDYSHIYFSETFGVNNTEIFYRHKNKCYLVLKIINDEYIIIYDFLNSEEFKKITHFEKYHNLKFDKFICNDGITGVQYLDENGKKYKFRVLLEIEAD